ncbi:MAG: nucleotidyltransferase domain-containing protein [Actinomycetia bacterium]|nr:nucleotidyltransferase domain-containing protein [Actinomycetes bacterium]
MELREGLTVEDSFLDEFAARHGVRRLALFGSSLGPHFGPASDIDLLVEFRPGRTPGLLQLAQMELELETRIGRKVDLRTYEDLSRFFRDDVAAMARPLYAT